MFEVELIICIKMDSALNKLQWLMWHKTKANQTVYMYKNGFGIK